MIFPEETLFERLASLVLGLAALSVLAGCQSASSKTTRFDGGQPFVTESLALSPGDEVDVRFYYTPELNVTQTVRPDGKIMLQLIGEVEARGKSPDELRAELLQRYGPQLKEPDITVLTRSLYTRRVYVGGQVMSPGVVNMPSQMTVLEAIMQSGGFRLPDAEVRNVVVIRHEDDQRYGYSVDVKLALEGQEAKPFYLQPMDIVHVPRTQITKVGQWVDQHINRLIPQSGLFFSHRRGDTTIGVDTSAR